MLNSCLFFCVNPIKLEKLRCKSKLSISYHNLSSLVQVEFRIDCDDFDHLLFLQCNSETYHMPYLLKIELALV